MERVGDLRFARALLGKMESDKASRRVKERGRREEGKATWEAELGGNLCGNTAASDRRKEGREGRGQASDLSWGREGMRLRKRV